MQSVRFKGKSWEIDWNGPAVEEELDKVLRSRLRKIWRFMERFIQNEFRKAKTGRIYKRGGVIHQASAPGEAPAIDEGRYRQSLKGNVRKVGTHSFELVAGTTVHGYPQYLETGVDEPGGGSSPEPESEAEAEYGSWRIAPRPVWRPALMKVKANIGKFLTTAKASPKNRANRKPRSRK